MNREQYEAKRQARYERLIAAAEKMDAAAKLPPEEITKERFWYMLEALPPVGWKHGAGCESFKMSERWSGNVTYIYARIGEKYFEMRDDIRTPHDVIIEKCKESMNKFTNPKALQILKEEQVKNEAFFKMMDAKIKKEN